jgi:aryl-alcohol dehydrogenase-like predicted oxidoreductase
MNHSRISLGTAQFGLHYGIGNTSGPIREEDISYILKTSESSGICTLDTAPEYGVSESRLGKYNLSWMNIGTKLPGLPGGDLRLESVVVNFLQGSLDRLNVQKVEYYLVHRASDLLGESGSTLFKILVKQKEQGLVGKVGVSVYTEIEADLILKKYPIDVIQVPFNVIDQRFVTSGSLDRLKNAGVEVHARSVFLQGLLLLPSSSRPVFFDKWSSIWENFDRWIQYCGTSQFEACLSFVLNVQLFDKVIIGIDNKQHFVELLSYLGKRCGPIRNPSGTCSKDPELINPSLWAIGT